jgi:hypothetical protein
LHTAHCGESWSHSCPLMCCPFFPFFVKHSSLTTHTPVSPACLIGSCQYVLVPVTRIKRISSHEGLHINFRSKVCLVAWRVQAGCGSFTKLNICCPRTSKWKIKVIMANSYNSRSN